MQDTSAKPESRPAAYSDLEALPPNTVAEILFGDLHVQHRPKPSHVRAATRLSTVLGGPFDLGQNGPGGWIIIVEPQLHLGDHVIVPDVAAWRMEKMPELPDSVDFEIAPDWVCEVLSSSTMRYDRTDKLAIYADFGVSHAWYIDPQAFTLEVLTLLDCGKYQISATYKDADPIAAPPFEAHTFLLDVLWPETKKDQP